MSDRFGYACRDMLCLSVSALTGDTFTTTLSPEASGADLWQQVFEHYQVAGSEKLPVLFIRESKLKLRARLVDQGLKSGDEMTLMFRQISKAEQNLVRKKMNDDCDLDAEEKHVWNSIKVLTLGSLSPVSKHGWPANVQSVTFGDDFNQSMEKVSLPVGLRSLTFGDGFDQNMEKVSLPAGLQSLTFGECFNQNMEKVSLPAGLQSLTFGWCFNQNMEKVSLPAGLQSLTFGGGFNQSMDKVSLPAGLQSLTFGQEHGEGESASWPAEPDFWLGLRPEYGKGESASWPAEPDFW